MDIASPQTPPTLQVKQKTSGLAITSLIFGIIPLSILTGIPAIIMGHIAMSKIKKSQGTIGGRGMALAGTILGYLSIVLIPILAGLITPVILKAKKSADRAMLINGMKQVGITLQENKNPDTGAYPESPGELPILTNDYKGDWYYFVKTDPNNISSAPLLVSPVSSTGFVILKNDGSVIAKKEQEFEAVISQGEGTPTIISPTYK